MGKRTQILLGFASIYVLWGSTFVAIRYVAQLLHPAFVSGLRYVIAGIILMMYLLLRGHSLTLCKGDWWRVALLGVIMFTINTTLISYGAKVLSAGITALFIGSIPLFIGLLEAALSKRKTMSVAGWAGTVTGFFGLAFLMIRHIQMDSFKRGTTWACIALLCAALAWAIGTVVSQRLQIKASSLVSSSWQMLIAGSINLLLGVALGGLRSSHWNHDVCWAVAYLATFGTLAGYTSYVFLIRNVRLSLVATYAYINPVVAVLLSWVLLNERLSAVEWVGMVIVLGSVAVVITSKAPAPRF
jgi:drug/metabolite transporter (DMT)-like permease